MWTCAKHWRKYAQNVAKFRYSEITFASITAEEQHFPSFLLKKSPVSSFSRFANKICILQGKAATKVLYLTPGVGSIVFIAV